MGMGRGWMGRRPLQGLRGLVLLIWAVASWSATGPALGAPTVTNVSASQWAGTGLVLRPALFAAVGLAQAIRAEWSEGPSRLAMHARSKAKGSDMSGHGVHHLAIISDLRTHEPRTPDLSRRLGWLERAWTL